MSNTVGSSKSVSADKSPASIADRMSDAIFKRQFQSSGDVDMPNAALKVDHTKLNSLLAATQPVAPVILTLLISADMTSLHLGPCLVSSGVIYASLKMAGTTPVDRELLKRFVKNGARMSKFSFSGFVGSGSLAQLLSGSDRTAAATSSTLSGRNSNDAVRVVIR